MADASNWPPAKVTELPTGGSLAGEVRSAAAAATARGNGNDSKALRVRMARYAEISESAWQDEAGKGGSRLVQPDGSESQVTLSQVGLLLVK